MFCDSFVLYPCSPFFSSCALLCVFVRLFFACTLRLYAFSPPPSHFAFVRISSLPLARSSLPERVLPVLSMFLSLLAGTPLFVFGWASLLSKHSRVESPPFAVWGAHRMTRFSFCFHSSPSSPLLSPASVILGVGFHRRLSLTFGSTSSHCDVLFPSLVGSCRRGCPFILDSRVHSRS
jgi:hypothetical protein